MHHALTWHASGANVTDRPRRAAVARYVADGTTWFGARRYEFNYTDEEVGLDRRRPDRRTVLPARSHGDAVTEAAMRRDRRRAGAPVRRPDGDRATGRSSSTATASPGSAPPTRCRASTPTSRRSTPRPHGHPRARRCPHAHQLRRGAQRRGAVDPHADGVSGDPRVGRRGTGLAGRRDDGVRSGRAAGHRHRRARCHRGRAGRRAPHRPPPADRSRRSRASATRCRAGSARCRRRSALLVRGADEIVQEIRDEVKDGVDLIKIAGSGPGTEEYGAFTLAELRAAVDEAHRLGAPDHHPRPVTSVGRRRRRGGVRLDHARVVHGRRRRSSASSSATSRSSRR